MKPSPTLIDPGRPVTRLTPIVLVVLLSIVTAGCTACQVCQDGPKDKPVKGSAGDGTTRELVVGAVAERVRTEQDQQLDQISRELNRAARDMRRSASSGQSEQQAQQMAQQALERMKKAQVPIRGRK